MTEIIDQPSETPHSFRERVASVWHRFWEMPDDEFDPGASGWPIDNRDDPDLEEKLLIAAYAVAGVTSTPEFRAKIAKRQVGE